MARKVLALLLVAVSLGACATIPLGPTVMALPAPGRSFEQFQGDDAACRQWAQHQAGATPGSAAARETASTAAIGTLIGAALGAAIGAVSGSAGIGAAIGAGSGLLGGTAVGAGAGQASGGEVQRRYDIAYQQCMYAKGNQVPVGIRSAYPYGVLPPPAPPPMFGAVPAPPPPSSSPAMVATPQPLSQRPTQSRESSPSAPAEAGSSMGVAGAPRTTCQTVRTEGHYETRIWPSGQRDTAWVPAHVEQVCQ